MTKESREQIKAELLKSLDAELDIWLEQESQIKDGYDYETTYIKFARKINTMILEKTMGKLPLSHNSKKNSKPL